ncbi:hypothetical protein Slin15195_G088500 [Septoria linicola]|uniref:Uncharacterized protein n=1 Tax=Septoria linicola TaxID=215465 RepID=A0A9Q9EL79_9PEZI|nr:hypothetical protein Slin15195_G088500 [Septoria linicola]
MFRDLSTTNIKPGNVNLRRRHQPHTDFSFQHNGLFHQSSVGSDEDNGGLDLSMHHFHGPQNRFASLATPAPTVPRDRAYYASGRSRRPRNSRGTREAKKRRDARRNKRSFAAQTLDEQLSRNIDQTLTMANIHPVPAITTASEAWKADLTFNWPSWSQMPPTPPQLPVLDFGSLDFNHFALPAAAKPKLPPTPPPVVPSVPIWCPYIPSLMRNGGWNGDVPRFTDLSSVPERKDTGNKNSLIIWPGSKYRQPKKQSRFFPSLTNSVSTPVIKLPPTRCRLHDSEQVPHAPPTTDWSDTFAREVVPHIKQHKDNSSTGHSSLSAVPDEDDGNLSTIENARLASTAKMWRILCEDGWLTNAGTETEEHPAHPRASSSDDSDDSGGIPIDGHLNQSVEYTPIPYVHLNSLVGHANEMGQPNAGAEDNPISSAMYLAEFFATPRAGTPMCELPATPYLRTTSPPLLHILNSSVEATSEQQDLLIIGAHEEMARSDEHYASEQDLFKPNDVPLPPSRAESPIDLTTFLSMGHVENCWCSGCGESPVLVGQKELLEDTSDDWLDWSTIGDEDEETSVSSGSKPVTAVEVPDEDEREFTRHPCVNASEWDEFYVPTSEHGTDFDEDSNDFLGYYDEGAAFGPAGDRDWVRLAS